MDNGHFLRHFGKKYCIFVVYKESGRIHRFLVLVHTKLFQGGHYKMVLFHLEILIGLSFMWVSAKFLNIHLDMEWLDL